MQRSSAGALCTLLAQSGASARRFVANPSVCVSVANLIGETAFAGRLEALRGRSVMIRMRSQLAAVRALVELDGIAGRLVLCTPDLPHTQLHAIGADARVDSVLTDDADPAEGPLPDDRSVIRPDPAPSRATQANRDVRTEWVLLTSGTTGPPKLALHTLASLTAPFQAGETASGTVWSTFYDIRRYGGLQILLRALTGGASMVLSDAGEAVPAFLRRAGAAGVTHISGTPSHWRGVLMSAGVRAISPLYVRLSGEACDQAILDRLREAYPDATIAHAFASTEAGVGFDVRDGRAGFPASLLAAADGSVRMRVEAGSLRLRSGRAATRYLGAHALPLADADGFIDTGDLVELRGDRYVFVGRRGGVINVGGHKVHPEAVEAVINQHPAVHASRVSARPSPITGALVVAEIVLREPIRTGRADFRTARCEILQLCRDRLLPHQVPVLLHETHSLDVAASGKLIRRHA